MTVDRAVAAIRRAVIVTRISELAWVRDRLAPGPLRDEITARLETLLAEDAAAAPCSPAGPQDDGR